MGVNFERIMPETAGAMQDEDSSGGEYLLDVFPDAKNTMRPERCIAETERQ
jgi:hypothetical protein